MNTYRVTLDVYRPQPQGGTFVAVHVEGSNIRSVRHTFRKGGPAVEVRGVPYENYRVISVRRVYGSDIIDDPRVQIRAFQG